jgi:hypothetical protein
MNETTAATENKAPNVYDILALVADIVVFSIDLQSSTRIMLKYDRVPEILSLSKTNSVFH